MPQGVYKRTKPNWNKGLTKETDERIKGHVSWNKGLSGDPTKDNYDERVAKNVEAARIPRQEYWKNPERRKEHSERLSIVVNSPIFKENHKRIMKIVMQKEEVKAHVSEGQIKRFKNSDEKKKNGERITKLWADSDSKFNSQVFRENKREIQKEKWQDPKFKKKMLKAIRKCWDNPKFREKMIKASFKARNMKPNNLERFFDQLTPDSIRYIGDGAFFVVTKKQIHNPDFKVTGQKKIIEIFGDYWHKNENPNKLIKEYAEANWDCKVFWESEVYDDTERVLEETLEFVKG